MGEYLGKKISDVLRQKSERRKWVRAIVSLSLAVLLVTNSLLALRGVALSQDEHTHTDACYEETTTLVCGQEESDGHQHTDECYTRVRGELVCQDTSEEHVHTDDCYEWHDELTCATEEGEGAHHHTEDCYHTERTLVCGMVETRSAKEPDVKEETGDAENVASDIQSENTETATAAPEVVPATVQAEEAAPVQLSAVNFADYLTDKTAVYYAENSGKWAETKEDVILSPEEEVLLHIAYEIPAGKINATNAEAEFSFPLLAEISMSEVEVRKFNDAGYSIFNGTDREANDLTTAGKVSIKEERDSDGNVEKRSLVLSFNQVFCRKNGGVTLQDGTVQIQPQKLEGFFELSVKAGSLLSLGYDEEDASCEIRWNNDRDLDSKVFFDPEKLGTADDNNTLTVYAAGTLEFKGPDYTVTATFDETAGLPEGIALQVEELQGEAYDDYLSQTQKVMGTDKSVTSARFFDITFIAEDGSSVEPKGFVDVRIHYEQPEIVSESGKVEGLHFSENGPQAIDVETAGPENAGGNSFDEVSFRTPSLSVYGIVSTQVITTRDITKEDENYTITVTYGKEAGIPGNASLEVREITAEDEEYADLMAKANSAINSADENGNEPYPSVVRFARFFDITIMNGKEKVVPKEPVTVTIDYKNEQALAEDESVSAVHFGAESTDIINVEPQFTEEAFDGVTFSANSFSVYGVVGTAMLVEEGDFYFEGQGYKIHLNVPATAQIPQGTEIVVTEIDPESDEYTQLLGEAWVKLNAEYRDYLEEYKRINKLLETETEELGDLPEPVALKNIDGVRFFDISFIYKNEEIEPSAPVRVEIELIDGMQLYDHYGTEIVHFSSTGTEFIEGVDARMNANGELVGVGFSQDTFSPIGILSVFSTVINQDSFSPTDLFSAFSPLKAYAAEVYTILKKQLNGTVTFYSDPACTNEITHALDGSTVYIKATPNENYIYSATTVTDVNEDPTTKVKVTKVGSEDGYDVYSFTMPAYNVLVTGVFQPPPQVDKKLDENHDGTYTLSLSVTGTSNELSGSGSTTKKVNVIVVMDRSSSMTTGVTVYTKWTEPYQAGQSYYGFVDGSYVPLNHNNDGYTYSGSTEVPYSGTVYQQTTGNNGDQYGFADGEGFFSIYKDAYRNRWYRSDNGTRYNGTRYLEVTSAPTGTPTLYGWTGSQRVTLNGEFGSLYYTTATTFPYGGTVYISENKTRLEGEQMALEDMVTELLSHNQDVDGLRDVVEIEVISFAAARGDRETTDYHHYENGQRVHDDDTESILTSDYDTIMTAVNSPAYETGTNWESAMVYAKEEATEIHNAQPGEDVYILFLTDGSPTERDTNTQGLSDLNASLDPAKAIIDATYVYPADYEVEELRGQDTGKHNYLYGVFTYGSASGSGQNNLKRFVNYAYGYGTKNSSTSYTTYTDDARGYLAKYFFDAQNQETLITAIENFIAAVFSSLSYGNVEITDGVTIGTSGAGGVTSTTLINGQATGFKYTVSGPTGAEMYSVTATGSDDNPTVTFHYGGTDYPGIIGTETIPVITDDTTNPVTTEERTLTYYTFEGAPAGYRMCLASVDENGLVHWDLSGIGSLMTDWTYTASFVVWPNQDAYDYAAGLNNHLAGYSWDTSTQVWVAPDPEKGIEGYYKNGVSDYEYIVRYPAEGAAADDLTGSVYAVLTNYEQSLDYNVVSKVTTNGETYYTYGESSKIDMPTPKPMPLEGSILELEKKWEDNMQPGAHDGINSVELELRRVSGSTDEVYVPDIVLTKENNWKQQGFSIAPGVMVSSDSEAYAYGKQYVTYGTAPNQVSYAILEPGHDYYFHEVDIDEQHYELTAYTYHPMEVDGHLYNVEFSYDTSGNITGVNKLTPMPNISATNTLRGGINIRKTVEDAEGHEVSYNGPFKTSVTLTVPLDEEGNLDFSHVENYYEDDNVTIKIPSVAWYRYYDSNDRVVYDEALIQAGILTAKLDEDGNEITTQYGRVGEGENYDGSGWFYLDFNDTTGTVTGNVLIHPDYTTRFTNMATGTEYTLTETETNGMTPSYYFSHVDYSGEEPETKEDGNRHYVIGNQENNVDVYNTTPVTEINLLKIGDGQESNTLEGVQFKLFYDEDCKKQVTKDALDQDVGDAANHILTTDQDGKAPVGSLTVGTYYLMEIDTVDGYNLLSSPAQIKIEQDTDGNGVATIKQEGFFHSQWHGVNDDGYLVIDNTSGSKLPDAGGPGTFLYTLGGIALIMGSAWMYGFRMRRRERRLN